MRENYKMQRLYVQMLPPAGASVVLSKDQIHYLLHVLRIKRHQHILLFDGKNGEWRAQCTDIGKKSLNLQIEEQTRTQPEKAKELIYCFAPLKQARLDYMVQKAVEMGATTLQPVITQFTQIHRLNKERVQANMIEAAEQCGILTLADYAEPQTLSAFLAHWRQTAGQTAKLIFCNEAQSDGSSKNNPVSDHVPKTNPLPYLQKLQNSSVIGLLIGPEGGFSDQERTLLYQQNFVISVPLGPRIMRADTAAVAALAVIQAVLGDW